MKPAVCNLALIGALLAVVLLAGCESSKTVSLPDVLPGAGAIPGWTPAGDMRAFNRETIYDLVDGQADAYFAYGFEQVAVRDYNNAAGAVLSVEVWQVATPADAYGLFTAGRSGAPVAVGSGGDSDPGRRLAFWQDRYFVRVRARQEVPDADLSAFAKRVASALPAGGEIPVIVNRLPRDGLAERSEVFFHEESSIQGELWLGGKNLLGLGPRTNGVLARYTVGGGAARLLLVQYPNAPAASAGLDALVKAGPEFGLAAARVRESTLGAVFGAVDQAAAGTLLSKILDK